ERVRGDQREDRDLSGRAVYAAVQPAADERAHAEAGTQRDEHEVGRALCGTEPVFRDRGEVHVVLDRAPGTQGRVELVEEAGPVDAGQRGPLDAAGGRVGDAGGGDHDRRHVGEPEPRPVYRVAGEIR